MPTVVDAHQHFWDLQALNYGWIPKDHPVLSRNYLPRDLAPILAQQGVQRTVLVQAHHGNEENRWALKLAKVNPFIAGIVGVADLADPDPATTLAEFAGDPRFVGVRFNVGPDSTNGETVKPDLARGVAALDQLGLACDLLIPPGQLGHVPVLSRAFPGVRFIVDHLGCPPIKSRVMEPWARQIEEVSECPNVWVKVSGLITQADTERWIPNDLKPYVHAAIELFGCDRLMFGSDWPVCLLAGSYERVTGALRDCLGALTENEQNMVWGGTATAVYDLVR
ncbi:MAG: amidohydrolase family protein [Planctomycetes bacterium]|nr:amidohydrolase family protein [Planctomycetota bacterium]